MSPKSFIDLWRSAGPDKWFSKDQAFDGQINERYGVLPDLIAMGEFDAWQDNAEGALALILVLDQFTRNIFRDLPNTFSYDQQARDIAERAIKAQFDRQFQLPLRRFFYLSFMHSEIIADQQRCLDLCLASDDEDGVKFARLHYDIIAQFGRFPHRNEVLGRSSTKDELNYLERGGFQG